MWLMHYGVCEMDLIDVDPKILAFSTHIMTNGNIFRVTDPFLGEPPVSDGFPSVRPVARSFDVFFDLRLNNRLSTTPRSL